VKEKMSILRKFDMKRDESEQGNGSGIKVVKTNFEYVFQVWECTIDEMVQRFESLTEDTLRNYKTRMDEKLRRNGNYLSMDEIYEVGIWPSSLVIFDYISPYYTMNHLKPLDSAGFNRLIYRRISVEQENSGSTSSLLLPPNMTPIIESATSSISYQIKNDHPLDGMWRSLILPQTLDKISCIYLRKEFADAVKNQNK
jgi:hypothetical protein